MSVTLQMGTGGGSRGVVLALLMSILTLSVTLVITCIGRLQRGNGASRGGAGGAGSLRHQLQIAEERLRSAVEKFRDERARSSKLEKRLSAVDSQLATVEQSLEREKDDSHRLKAEVEELQPRSRRLEALDIWIWPPQRTGAGGISPLFAAIEESCRGAAAQSEGRSLFARLHLISTNEKDEPDRFAELLDLAGRDFYRWFESSGVGSEDATPLESDFMAFAGDHAGRHDLELRPVRPGDTVDPELHEPIGSGLHVVKPRSFLVRRKSDREVIRRALVEV